MLKVVKVIQLLVGLMYKSNNSKISKNNIIQVYKFIKYYKKKLEWI